MRHIRQLEGYRDLLALHQFDSERYPYLLQSVACEVGGKGAGQARFDILFAFPGETLQLDSGATAQGDFLRRLDEQWQAGPRTSMVRDGLPFAGGWFLYLGYELAMQVEPSLDLPAADDNLPVAFAARVPAAVIVDHHQRRTLLVAEPDCGDLLERMAADLEAVIASADSAFLNLTLDEETPQRYLDNVNRVKQYIVDGDVFQVNLSRSWRGELATLIASANVPVDLYRRLCMQNPAPFAGLALIGDTAIISSSPERLVCVRNGWVETRPIAGTRPRGYDKANDQTLQAELLAHPKERAEHIMLIDLERNDLGRICIPGTVEVDELMTLESYAHVHHIVSNVRGELRDGITPGEVIRAVFPGGTITGCPKVRCMEIIAELEGEGRGAYTGSMGYLNHDGSLDLNILIRTIVQHGNQIQLRGGGGIVVDSVPEWELDETRAKVRGMLLALAD